MLEQILELVKQHGQQTVVDNPDVPNDLNNQVLSEAASTITGGLQNVLSGGGLQNLIGMFTGGGQSQANSGGMLNNPIVGALVSQLAGNLVGKLNLSPQVAGSVSNSLIPSVINSLVNRTVSNAPQDSGFNLNHLVSTLTGGGSGGGIDFQNLLNQFTQGGHANVDPDVNAQLANQAKQNQQGGGLADLIQGFFK